MIPYRAYGPWLRQRFGQRVYKVAVDGGFTCPNRDGQVAWGGCTYCNNDSFRPEGSGVEKPISEQIANGIDYLSQRFLAKLFLIYWQNYSNTYAPVDQLQNLYSSSLAIDNRIVGLCIGTRPDCVENQKLDMIAELSAKHYVCMEYGMESIYDETLTRINRGHDFACLVDAVRRTQERGLDTCIHVILGFPYETRSQMLQYADALNDLNIDFVKLHHLHIVKGTRLAKDYQEKPFPTFGYREWIDFIINFLERLNSRIVIQRLYGWAPEEDLIAPIWGKTKAQLLHDISVEMKNRRSWQGKRLEALTRQAGPGSVAKV